MSSTASEERKDARNRLEDEEEGEFWQSLESDYPYDVGVCETPGSGQYGYKFSYSDKKSPPETDSENGPPIFLPPLWAEDTEILEYFGPILGEQEESLQRSSTPETSEVSESPPESVPPEKVVPDQRRKSIFVHSCPSHFSDINRARKSVFGSIFLRTAGRIAEETALLKSVADSNYSMMQSLLNSLENIMNSVPPDSEKRHVMLAYKEAIHRMLESHGIRRTFSDGSVHWDIYPIAQSYLFTIQVDDRIHQTRHLSRIEERIISGTTQTLKMPYEWPTNSVWSGNWDNLGMSGSGTYIMPHGVSYSGKMKDGMFHDASATLTYPNKFKAINCVYENGELKDCQFQFPDNLLHEKENWNYCRFPDRRFWSEVKNGLKPAKLAQKTEIDPPRKIPAGCYDTSDGFYNPKTFALTSRSGEMLKVPLREEAIWIRRYCRKGFLEQTGFRPDLFENWYDFDTDFINEILKHHDNYRKEKITYDDLMQFYAENEMLLPTSDYQKKKSPSELEMIIYKHGLPEPIKLTERKTIAKYKGHKISRILTARSESTDSLAKKLSSRKFPANKSILKFNHSMVKSHPSKINFKFSGDSLSTKTFSTTDERMDWSHKARKIIPEKYLIPQPIQRQPFLSPRIRRIQSEKSSRKCAKSDFDSDSLPLDQFLGDSTLKLLRKKRLEKFVRDIIMEAATKAIHEEREKQRKRLKWASRVPFEQKEKFTTHEKSVKMLEKIFQSIPEQEEYCDSDPAKACDLKKLAEDKYNTLKYWGKRMFMLNFED